jgi:hypothetical protein
MSHRMRVGFFLTILLGAMWSSAGLFADTDTQFLTGIVVAMLGVIGLGAVDWTER